MAQVDWSAMDPSLVESPQDSGEGEELVEREGGVLVEGEEGVLGSREGYRRVVICHFSCQIADRSLYLSSTHPPGMFEIERERI
jgi:hypothetical protein